MSYVNLTASELALLTVEPQEVGRLRYRSESLLEEASRCDRYASERRRWVEDAKQLQASGKRLTPKEKNRIASIERWLQDAADYTARAEQCADDARQALDEAVALEIAWRNARAENIRAISNRGVAR